MLGKIDLRWQSDRLPITTLESLPAPAILTAMNGARLFLCCLIALALIPAPAAASRAKVSQADPVLIHCSFVCQTTGSQCTGAKTKCSHDKDCSKCLFKRVCLNGECAEKSKKKDAFKDKGGSKGNSKLRAPRIKKHKHSSNLFKDAKHKHSARASRQMRRAKKRRALRK